MKVCGIVGSPKKGSNVDLLVSQILEGAKSSGAETGIIYLNDLDMKPCQSCGIDPFPEFCLFHDGMEGIYAALHSSDVIVLGSPVYFDTVSAQTKLMIDRCNCLMPYVEKPDGMSGFEKRMEKKKKGIFVSSAGTEQEFETIKKTVSGFFMWANVEWIDTILHPHDDSGLGGVKNNRELMERAFEIGIQMAKDNR